MDKGGRWPGLRLSWQSGHRRFLNEQTLFFHQVDTMRRQDTRESESQGRG